MSAFLDIIKILRDANPRHVASATLKESSPPSVNESYVIIQLGRGPKARKTLGKSQALKEFKEKATAELVPQLAGVELDTNKAYMLVLVHHRKKIETIAWSKGKAAARWVKQDVGNWRKSTEDVIADCLNFGDQANFVVMQIKQKAEYDYVDIHIFEVEPEGFL